MASINRTAYPRFREGMTQIEITEWFTPTEDEIEFAYETARYPQQQANVLIMLKSVQHLGYFSAIVDIPITIQAHICKCLQIPADSLPFIDARRSRTRYRAAIRAYLNINPYSRNGEAIVDEAVKAAVETMSDPADLINVALEQLHNQGVELPGFSLIERRVATLRSQAHQKMYERILAQLSVDQQAALDKLLTVPEKKRLSSFTRLKETPGNVTLKNLRLWEKRLVWLKSLLDASPFLTTITNTKRKQFAAQAHALELGDLRDIHNKGRRYTLLLCLLHDAKVTTFDQVATMFLRQMRRIHHNARNRLQKLREEYEAIVEMIVEALGEIAHSTVELEDDARLGRSVRQTLDEKGGAKQMAKHTDMLSAYHNNNYLPLMWACYRSHRALLFRLVEHLMIQTATQDSTVTTALVFLLPYKEARRKYLPADIELSFASQRWQQLVKAKYRRQTVLRRKQLEICIFNYVALGLSRGDLYIEGSEAYADYRKQLLPWEECEPLVDDYCDALDLPNTATGLVEQLRQRLTAVANKVDAGFPENSDFSIDADGQPHLKRTSKQPKPDQLDEFRDLLADAMPERHLLDILKFVHHWVHYTHHFGPPSGSQPKMHDAAAKYLLTIFGYGCGLGAAQTAKHTRGVVTRRSMKRINDQHISVAKLETATRDIINEYARFRLPFLWGDGKHAVADGTHVKLLDNNLLGQHHFRYGEYGAIAYHHVSDTYVALFAHFIACGVWEAVYILDGLLKNESAIQPDTIHADTQGQMVTVFGLAHLLGIQLMPRMRNWNKVTLCRPDAGAVYKHIDSLFTDTINWTLLEKHWQDLMQVVLSIQAGKVLPSVLLRKLGVHNRQNKLYKAFAELGRVMRTIFVLEYLSNLELRQQIQAATTLVERYNEFMGWLNFGGDGVIRVDDPVEQEKRIKYLNLVANAVMLHNVVDITNALQTMRTDGHTVTKELIAHISPYITQHIKRFGEYFLDMDELPPPLDPDKPILPEHL